MRSKAADYDVIVVGTISAALDPQQAILANQLIDTGVPTVTVAMRTPYDLNVYDHTTTYVCSYGLRQPALAATAAALFGVNPFQGRLPVSVSDRYPLGHGLDTGGTS